MPSTPVLDRTAALLPGQPRAAACAEFFGGRAPLVDRDEAGVADGLRWLRDHGLLAQNLGGLSAGHEDGVQPAGAVIAAIARHCTASAFALWCHRMVLEYVWRAEEPAFPRERLLDDLCAVSHVGSTALGVAMAHVVTGSPLSVTFQDAGDSLLLEGRVPWASNLLPDEAVMVTAAIAPDGRRIVVLVPLDTPGVDIAPYPRLLALQATRSSSLKLSGVRVPRANVISRDLPTFLRAVRPTFLALQSSFCLGLASAALDGAQQELRASHSALEADLRNLLSQREQLETALNTHLREPTTVYHPMRSFVQLRLDLAQLAGAATRLEVAIRGGRAYSLSDPAGRRFREAAFLPVQAPTEAQLRWELSHSA